MNHLDAHENADDVMKMPSSLEVESKAVSFIEHNGTATRKDIEKVTGISQASCVRLLNALECKGVVERQGKARNTYYTLSGKKKA